MKPKKTVVHILVLVEIVVLIGLSVFAVWSQMSGAGSSRKAESASVQNSNNNENKKMENTEVTEAYDKQTDNLNASGQQNVTAQLSEEVKEKLESMTLEEKVAQMFVITPEQLTGMGQVILAGATTEASVNEYPVGGLVYGAQNFQGQAQTSIMLSKIQEYSQARIGLDMFLTVEEEGGDTLSPVAKINQFEVQQTESELGSAGDTTASNSAAGTMVDYLTSQGFNFSLSTVTDLADGNDAVLDARTFGEEEEKVSEFVNGRVEAFVGKGMLTAVKYFPEKSSAKEDAETKFLISTKSLDEHKTSDFVTCQAGIDAGAECVVLSNVIDRELSGSTEQPCSLMSETVTYLRNNMGFEGIIMTDSLSDESITANYSPQEAAVQAVQAGVNLLYNPSDFKAAYEGVLEAIQNGILSEEQIDDAVGYVLMQKM